MQKWLQQVQRLWEERRTEKSAVGFEKVEARLNYQKLMTGQDPSCKYVVLYNASGTNLVSCVLSKQALPPFSIDGASLSPRGFIADAKTYAFETNSDKEAHYLCACLNSSVVNEAIKPLQPRGLWGARDIHRRPFMLNIPKFSQTNSTHIRLSELSKQCHEKVSKLTLERMSSGRARATARESVSAELEEISRIVSGILGL
jgi:hypothetical protein